MDVAEAINSSRMHFWCASVLNPPWNDRNSNPFEIYLQLHRLSRGGERPPDVAKLEDLQISLPRWADSLRGPGIDRLVYYGVRARIIHARPEDFQPVMFHLVEIRDAIEKGQPRLARIHRASL